MFLLIKRVKKKPTQNPNNNYVTDLDFRGGGGGIKDACFRV